MPSGSGGATKSSPVGAVANWVGSNGTSGVAAAADRAGSVPSASAMAPAAIRATSTDPVGVAVAGSTETHCDAAG
jgi:hypothetical protein